VGVTAAAVWFGSQAILSFRGLFISPLAPLIALVSIFSIVTLIKFIREEFRSREQAYLLSKAQELTLHSLASLAETRDDETGNHLIRTKYYVRLLAEYLSRNNRKFAEFADKKNITYLYKSAPLHDIGKVGIPDRILLKPGKLTDAEFEEMKRHTEYGRLALDRAEERLGQGKVSSYFRFAKELAYYHHERWEGNGYPRD
jgi:putative two-component system response regulator